MDQTKPIIRSIKGNDPAVCREYVTLTVNAKSETGLLYSFDGGINFTKNSKKTFIENQTVIVTIKDRAGNIDYKEIEIDNIDRTKPSILNSNETLLLNESFVLDIETDEDALIKTTGLVNTNIKGTYNVLVQATDKCNNKTLKLLTYKVE
jgi:hypothetical protein